MKKSDYAIKAGTKIVATLGPATCTLRQIERLAEAGANGFRLNFSHGEYDFVKEVLQHIRTAEKKLGIHLTTIQDLQGPKIRLNSFKKEKLVKDGDVITFGLCKTSDQDTDKICITYPHLIGEAKSGEKIFIDDGKIALRIKKIFSNKIEADVLKGGLLLPRKGVNFPHANLSVPALTEKDIKDLEFGAKHQMDYIALSFVRSAKDIKVLKTLMKKLKYEAGVIPKIEKPEAIYNLESIIDESDAILLARGDLGVEVDVEHVPSIQKNVLALCKIKKIPVIVATHMLESMITNPLPTRAEVTDVYQAVQDGADVVMLSGETAVGKYPVDAVKMMKKITVESEANIPVEKSTRISISKNTDEAIAVAGRAITDSINAKFICCFTSSGWTAKLLSKTGLKHPVIAFTNSDKVSRKINLYRGVTAINVNRQIPNTDKMFETASDILKKEGLAKKGDTLVILAGQPIGKSGTTNMLKVLPIG